MISFTLSKLLPLLIYPLSLSLVLCLLGLIFLRLWWTRVSFYTLLLAVVWLYLCSTALFSNFLMNTLERDYVPRAMSVLEKADAIVVLGGGTRGDTHMGRLPDLNEHADRLLYAAELFKAGKAPVILLSGGGAENARPEAQQMKDVLEVMGINERHMMLENVSRNTHENAVFSAQILKSRKLQRVLLVTSAFHMRRSQALFEAQGVEVIPAPTDYQQLVAPPVIPVWLPTVGSLHQTTDVLHEIVGLWVYRWQGRL